MTPVAVVFPRDIRDTLKVLIQLHCEVGGICFDVWFNILHILHGRFGSKISLLQNLGLWTKKLALRKIPYFHLISWCGNFMERHSFRIVSGDSPETMRKLCLSTKFPHQEIRWNYGILRSVELVKLGKLDWW